MVAMTQRTLSGAMESSPDLNKDAMTTLDTPQGQNGISRTEIQLEAMVQNRFNMRLTRN